MVHIVIAWLFEWVLSVRAMMIDCSMIRDKERERVRRELGEGVVDVRMATTIAMERVGREGGDIDRDGIGYMVRYSDMEIYG